MLETVYFGLCYLVGVWDIFLMTKMLLFVLQIWQPYKRVKARVRGMEREQEGRRDGGTDRVREREGDI